MSPAARTLIFPIALALTVFSPLVARATSYSWDGSSGTQFTNSNNWTPAGIPGAADTTTFRLGAVPVYPVWLFQGLFDPIDVTVDRMIVGTNTASFAGGVLTVDSTNTTETGRGLIIGQTASDVAVVNSGLQGLSTVYATLGSAAGSSGTLNVSAGSFNVTGLTPTYDLIVGLFGSGAINVSGGHQVNVSDATVLGLYSGSSGTATVSGAGTTWDNSGGIVYVGGAGSGAIDVTGGGQLTAERVTIANETGSSGDVNVTGPSSTLTSSGPQIAVGYRGTGSLDITAGGSVTGKAGYVGYGTSLDGPSSTGVGTALVDGADSNWTNANQLFVGSFYTTGTLTISNGGRVTSFGGAIGHDTGAAVSDRSVGTVNVTGSTSLWNNSSTLYVGNGPQSDGTLNITSGGRVNNGLGHVGDRSGSTGNVTVDGLNSLWNNSGPLRVGTLGSSTLTVTNNGVVQATEIDIYAFGEARGNGTLVGFVQNYGLVAPGTSVGTLDITGNYTQFADGELRVELASATSYDRLEITGVALLDGTLTVSLLDGFMPALGDSFGFLFASGGFGGQFASLSLPSLTPGLKWQLNPGGATLFLNVVAGLLGDYNLNGTVDAADYTVWRNTLGQMGAGLAADGNQSGSIDAGDYAIWKMHFGDSPGSGSAGASSSQSPVPEPGTLSLMLVDLIAALLIRGVRRPGMLR